MSSHNIAQQLFGVTEMRDPGNAGTLTIDRSPAIVGLVSTGAETRTLSRPTRTGGRCFLYMKTDGGDITVTITGGYNEAGSTTYVFSDAGQFLELVAAYDGTNYFWREVAGSIATGLASLQFYGSTSGIITIQPLAVAGTYTLTLPPDDGDAGEQLQTDGSGVLTWEAAGSLREVKAIIDEGLDPEAALGRVLSANVYQFKYKQGARPTTGDFETVYHGVVAEEYPEVMHHGGRIFNAISAFGETVLAIQAIMAKLNDLLSRVDALEKPPATKRGKTL